MWLRGINMSADCLPLTRHFYPFRRFVFSYVYFGLQTKKQINWEAFVSKGDNCCLDVCLSRWDCNASTYCAFGRDFSLANRSLFSGRVVTFNNRQVNTTWNENFDSINGNSLYENTATLNKNTAPRVNLLKWSRQWNGTWLIPIVNSLHPDQTHKKRHNDTQTKHKFLSPLQWVFLRWLVRAFKFIER